MRYGVLLGIENKKPNENEKRRKSKLFEVHLHVGMVHLHVGIADFTWCKKVRGNHDASAGRRLTRGSHNVSSSPMENKEKGRPSLSPVQHIKFGFILYPTYRQPGDNKKGFVDSKDLKWCSILSASRRNTKALLRI